MAEIRTISLGGVVQHVHERLLLLKQVALGGGSCRLTQMCPEVAIEHTRTD